MHPGHVRGVEQVVHQPEVVAAHGHAVALGQPPAGVVVVLDVDDGVVARQRRVAHPDEEQSVAVAHRVAAHARMRGDALLRRRVDAAAAAVEGQAVVAALEGVALDAAHRQRQPAVRAGVLQRHGRATLGAVEHHRLAEQAPRHGRAAHLAREGRRVPRVPEESGHRQHVEPPKAGQPRCFRWRSKKASVRSQDNWAAAAS